MAEIYARQELFLGPQSQKLLMKKTAAIIGLGSLGSRAAHLLTRGGIGKLILVDFDRVHKENIGAQEYYLKDVGKPKVLATKKKLLAINPIAIVSAVRAKLTPKNISKIIQKPDILLDGTDNIETRHTIDEYCRKKKIPWVFGACIRGEGMVYSIISGGPTYSNIFAKPNITDTCDTCGVLNSAAATVAAAQAAEALKILTGKPPCRNLLFFDVWRNAYEQARVLKRGHCGRSRNK